MIGNIENAELKRFHTSVLQDLRVTQITDEEGGSFEQLFTQWAVDLLAEAGETENVRVSYDEKALGTRNQHKINAYSLSDNYETIDMFITVLKGTDELSKVTNSEIETATKRIVNFFRKAVYKEYVNEIEESSPIFDFAHTLCNSKELKENLVRVNIIILSDGIFQGDIPKQDKIYEYPIFFRVVDINYLYNISEKSHIPIEIDFLQEGFTIPCIISPSDNDEYQSYLAIIPGEALSSIYERFGSRLLEQNVRSFLQFTGKINSGIRNTILKEPHMFLAFNNGISATAESIEFVKDNNGHGLIISKVNDLQIVNGGQTTASIYHTLKKDKADISRIFIQLKLSVIKNRDNFSGIVSRISEYANTQNKVSISDLSSNRPYHIELEKLSRSYFTPHTDSQLIQTRWFYERARGQYKNARMTEGFSKARQKNFDLINPKCQMFTKEDLAKYINSYQEVQDGKKIVIGPHFVVRGNQKNYVQFMNFNLEKKINNIYYEDTIAKAILFRSAEKIYGIKPNSIGDMRYITVPYSISLFSFLTNSKLDLYKIWKKQSISDELKSVLYNIMIKVESFIKGNAPGALYGEWAKKEECWTELKRQSISIDDLSVQNDLMDENSSPRRLIETIEDTEQEQNNKEIERLKSVPPAIWRKIEEFGRTTGSLTPQQINIAFTLQGRIRNDSKIYPEEKWIGLKILDIVIEKYPELLEGIDDITENQSMPANTDPEINIELMKKMIEWDKKNNKLDSYLYKYINEIIRGRALLTGKAKNNILKGYKEIKRYGFSE